MVRRVPKDRKGWYVYVRGGEDAAPLSRQGLSFKRIGGKRFLKMPYFFKSKESARDFAGYNRWRFGRDARILRGTRYSPKVRRRR